MSRSRTTVVVLGLAVLAGAVTAAVLVTRSADPVAPTSVATSTATAPPPFSTPTPSAPSSLVVEPGPDVPVATDPVPTSVPGAADVVVGYADVDGSSGVVEVAGFVTGVVEDGGTCTLTLTRDGRSVQADGPGAADATTTTCGSLTIGLDQLSSGSWQAVLSYDSASAAGSSAPTSVEIP